MKWRKGPNDMASLGQAESHLKRAVELDPMLGVGYLQLGILYSERQDFSQRRLCLQEATKATPQLEEAHYRLSQAYKRTGDKLKAEEELQLYNQISKKKDEEVERERRENRQFVYTLRSPARKLATLVRAAILSRGTLGCSMRRCRCAHQANKHAVKLFCVQIILDFDGLDADFRFVLFGPCDGVAVAGASV